ncbi:hypothetical protein F3Y22_tig00110621pilonHSYRG00023 [Hibiscus syriacus]|uniref:CBS domain-containing protein n=1 Tax=Hibiscus syriacus TaxID=106335 RepID=A0A6A2ZZI2_HIBSY|nr:hypothetical protein F3Y22_tig00110621pilonHSYRG00023 [Hibiscus syriacus]
MASLQLKRESDTDQETPQSPEAKLGMEGRIYGVFRNQSLVLQRSSMLALRASLSLLSLLLLKVWVEIRSDASLAEAVRILAQNKILSVPVVNPPSMMFRLNMQLFEPCWGWWKTYPAKGEDGLSAEFHGFHVLVYSEQPSPRSHSLFPSGTDVAVSINGMTSAVGLGSSRYLGNIPMGTLPALQKSTHFDVTAFQYKMKSVPVVDLGEGKIDNIITQSAVIHMLADALGFTGSKAGEIKNFRRLVFQRCHLSRLSSIQLMRKNRIGGVPVIESGGRKAIGNISLRDVQFLLIAPEIYRDYRSITAKNFLIAVKKYLEKHDKGSPMLSGTITCKRDKTIKELIKTLDSQEIHRMYVVDGDGNLEGVITLRDIYRG